jgi:hypothetical protein
MYTYTYVSTEHLSELLPYDERTIRNRLKESCWLEGAHHLRGVGGAGRKLIGLKEPILRDLRKPSATVDLMAGIQ